MTNSASLIRQGRELLSTGDQAGALERFERAARYGDEHGNLAAQIEPLQLTAQLYMRLNQTDKLLETYERLQTLFKAMEAPIARGRILNDLGLLQARLKRYEDALQNFGTALALFESQQEMLHAAGQHGNIGSVHRDMQHYSDALQSYDKALILLKDLDHPEGIADQYTNIAYIHVMANRLDSAQDYYRKAIPLYKRAGADEKAAMVLENLKTMEGPAE